MIGSAISAAILWAALGVSAGEEPAPNCLASWQLVGAASTGGAASVWDPAWEDKVERIAMCAGYLIPLKRCLAVVGHADKTVVRQEVADIFGGQQAAQLSRAMGRAQAVASRLRGLGVPQAMLLLEGPVLGSTFRGVVVRPVTCSPLASVDTVVAPSRPAPPPKQAMLRVQIKNPPRDKWWHAQHWWLDAGVDASLLWAPDGLVPDAETGGSSPGDTLFAPAVRLGLSYVNNHMYGRLGGALVRGLGPVNNLSLASRQSRAHRIGGEVSATTGYAGRIWQLGIGGGARLASAKLSDPWVDRMWWVGLESRQCLLRFGTTELCLWQSAAPLGRYLRRAQSSQDGVLETIPTASRRIFRLDAGLVLRQGFKQQS